MAEGVPVSLGVESAVTGSLRQPDTMLVIICPGKHQKSVLSEAQGGQHEAGADPLLVRSWESRAVSVLAADAAVVVWCPVNCPSQRLMPTSLPGGGICIHQVTDHIQVSLCGRGTEILRKTFF